MCLFHSCYGVSSSDMKYPQSHMKEHSNHVLGPPWGRCPSEQEGIIQSWTLNATGDETQKRIYCGPIVKSCRLGGTRGGCVAQHLHKAGPVTSGCSGTCPVKFWMPLRSSAKYWWSQNMYQSFAESCLLLWHFSCVLYLPHSEKTLWRPTHSTAFVFSASVILPREGSRGKYPFCNWLPEMRKGVTFVSIWVWVGIIQIPSEHLFLIIDQGSTERHCDSRKPCAFKWEISTWP